MEVENSFVLIACLIDLLLKMNDGNGKYCVSKLFQRNLFDQSVICINSLL